MSEKTIIQHLHERRLGISSYDRPMPETPIYLAPDMNMPGRFVGSDGTPLDRFLPGEHDRTAVVWFPCDKTTASRIPERRTKRSFRIRMNDVASNREMVTESTLEFDFLRIMRAESRDAVIHDQPPARRFIGPDGAKGWHTFDFLIEEPSGSRLAYAVRPMAKIDQKLRTALRCVEEQSLAAFADAIILVTETFVTAARTFNANEILDARENRNEADVRRARSIVDRIRGGVMLDDLVQAIGIGPRGRTALLCLVDDGVLDFVRRERLTAATLLRPANPALKPN
ncbi:hypothetical protein [Aureimonas sp. AU22]|uniref:hypothetical protein n=1 Tax=Aureimonas sp. AU22 TaxID=1638162 RepID=UPI00078437A7|nr:hypothetical protein [Aureimonas sp. AU22]